MAIVKLRNPDRYDDELPDVCMKCGAPATVRKAKTFSWHPGWVYVLLLLGLLPFVIVALVMTKRRTVRAPLCDAHRNHWLWRTLVILGSFFGLFAVAFVVFIASVQPDPRGAQTDFTGWACLGCVLALFVWVILAAVLSMTAVRAAEITDRSITLVGVSREFADAYYQEDQRTFARDVERTVRERWRQDHGRPRPDDDRYREDDPETRRRREQFREEED
jgi:hypothetical protein